jgi:magnesium-transporting ATPase (P-type)
VGTATAIAREAGILPPVGTSLQPWLAATAALAGTPPAALQGYHSAASASLDGAAAGAHGEASGHVEQLPPGVVMEGPEFRQRVLNEDGSIREEEFLALWPTLRVLARCSPADKYTIVTGVGQMGGGMGREGPFYWFAG